MTIQRKMGVIFSIACAIVAVSFPLQSKVQSVPETNPEQLAEFTGRVDKALKDVSKMTGLAFTEPVKVEMITRPEVADFIRRVAAMEYPDGELSKRGRCFSEIGLLPKGYDYAEGMIDLVGEQAGAIYDQHTKTLLGISDLPAYLQDERMQMLFISHEACHALEDRVVDMTEKFRETLTDIDGEYAFRSAIEGMATVVMLAYSQGLPVEDSPDARATMRSGFSRSQRTPGMKALAASPPYLAESLISPYAEGGAFAQDWLRAHRGAKLGAMLAKMPTTSEQVLHFEKYVEGDAPTAIDLAPAAQVLPEGWTFFYTNTLGEFDLQTLFELRDETRPIADQAAEGWDGFRFAAYSDTSDRLLVVGSSVWDSEADAAEFISTFWRMLDLTRDTKDFNVLQTRDVVSFAIGPMEAETRTRILEALGAPDTVKNGARGISSR